MKKRLLFTFTHSINATNMPLFELLHVIKNEYQLKQLRRINSISDLFNSEENDNPIVDYYEFRQSCLVKMDGYNNRLIDVSKKLGYLFVCGELLSVLKINTLTEELIKKTLPNQYLASLKSHGYFLSSNNVNQPRNNVKDLYLDSDNHTWKLLKNFGCKELFDSNIREILYYQELLDSKNIWILQDSILENNYSINPAYPKQEIEPYLFFLKPLIINNNQLYDLDDADDIKPYWKGIDTTPQRLAGAMLNISDISTDIDGMVVDPFIHTGTTMLEASSKGIKNFLYNDRFETIGAEDNYKFFVNPGSIKEFANIEEEFSILTNKPNGKIYDYLISIARETLSENPGKKYPDLLSIDEVIPRVDILSIFRYRILFYLIRRWMIENWENIKDITRKIDKVKQENITYYIQKNLDEYRNYFDYLSLADSRNQKLPYVIRAHFTQQLNYKRLMEGNNIDILKYGLTLKSGSVNAIVTDPPYGYGSNEQRDVLIKLYKKFFIDSIKSIKNGGYLTFCTLEEVKISYPGLNVINTANVYNILTKMINDQSTSFIIDDSINNPQRTFYYWVGNHRLNRSIIKIRVSK